MQKTTTNISLQFAGLREIHAGNSECPKQQKRTANGWNIFGGGIVLSSMNVVFWFYNISSIEFKSIGKKNIKKLLIILTESKKNVVKCLDFNVH